MRAGGVLLLMLAGCGEGVAPAPAPTFAGPSAFQRQVMALPPAEKNIVFIRAIQDAGKECQRVTGSEFKQNMPSGEQLYVARCIDGASFGVLMGRDGAAKILSRS